MDIDGREMNCYNIYIYELQATLQKRISIIVVKKYRLT